LVLAERNREPANVGTTRRLLKSQPTSVAPSVGLPENVIPSADQNETNSLFAMITFQITN